MSLRKVLVFDAVCVGLFLILAIAFPGGLYDFLHLAGVFLIAFLLHGLIVPFKGLDYVIWDAPPDSPIKYYWFLVIFLAVFGGGLLRNLAVELFRLSP